MISAVAATTLAAPGMASLAPAIVWQREFMYGDGYSIFQLSDGTFAFNSANDSATFIVKTDGSGNFISSSTIKIGNESTILPYFAAISNGGYALAGIMGKLYALEITNPQGNPLWTKTYSSEAPISYLRSMIQTSDGGFALAGFGQQVDEGEGWIWFARTDSSGSLLWNKTLAGPLADCPSKIIPEPDGGFMISDVSFSVTPNQAYFRLIKIDQNGNVLWNQTYGDLDKYRIPECNTAIATSDGGYLIGGFLSGRNAWIVKTDAEGEMQWNKTYGGQNDAVVCAQQTQDGGYVFASVQNRTQAWVLKTDAVGNEEWNMTFPDATFPVGLEANFNSIIQVKDGSYFVLGTKDGNAWLAKLEKPETSPLILPIVQMATAVSVTAACALVGFALFRRRHMPKPHESTFSKITQFLRLCNKASNC